MVVFGLPRIALVAFVLGSMVAGAGLSLAQSTPSPPAPLADPNSNPARDYPEPNLSPLNLNVLQDPNRKPVRCAGTADRLDPNLILTPETICQQGLTPPSLWWIREQFEAQSPEYAKLLTTWLTYLPQADRPGRGGLVVNLQRWSVMDYFSRYEFLHVFGGEASRSGYNTRVFNLRGEFLGSYTCTMEADTPRVDPDYCHIAINRVGRILHGE
ncbi:MAG: hypothetical protein ACO4AI_03420 [Prochlorothrix sp.]